MSDPYRLNLSAAHHSPRDHNVFAWSVRVRLPWFRALPLSCIERVLLSLGGAMIAEGDLLFHLDGRLATLPDLQALSDRYWSVDEALQIGVKDGVPVPPAGTEVAVELTLRMPDSAGTGDDWARRTTHSTVRLVGAGEPRWPLGVCTFSFSGELRRGRSLRSCLHEVATLGGYGAVELLGAQVVEDYPAPAPRWLDRFSDLVRETGLVPLCYDGFIDPGRTADRTAGDADLLRWAEMELDIAAALGCSYVRLNLPPRRRLFENLAAAAERRNLAVLTELHAQTADDASVRTLLELLDELQTPQLALILDLSCVMRSLPAGFLRGMSETGVPRQAVQLIESGWREGVPLPALQARLTSMAAGEEATRLAQRAYRLFRHSDTSWLPDVLPVTRIIHGKFYEMAAGHEPAIPYQDVLVTLSEVQFDGYIMSEYEGHLWHDSPDTFGQLREHRRMISALSNTWPVR